MKERFNPRFETTNDVLFSLTMFLLIEFKDGKYVMAGSWNSGFIKCVVWVKMFQEHSVDS